MTMVSFKRYDDYAPDSTLHVARARYFALNGFGPDGGYGDAWVDFKLGPIPFPFPNTKARVKAVRYHDLHHVLTGYGTDFWGETDISAWELGAGCRDYMAAWQLNLGGLACGALFEPRRTFRAFVRGLRSESLYGKAFEPLLGRTVGDVRRELGIDGGDPPARAMDRVRFVLLAALGLVVGLSTFVVFLALLPFAWLPALLARLSRKREGGKAMAGSPNEATVTDGR